jgi:hypothetical protein
MPETSSQDTFPVYDKVPNSDSRVGSFDVQSMMKAMRRVAALNAQKNKKMISPKVREIFLGKTAPAA